MYPRGTKRASLFCLGREERVSRCDLKHLFLGGSGVHFVGKDTRFGRALSPVIRVVKEHAIAFFIDEDGWAGFSLWWAGGATAMIAPIEA
jgi:hypothetical protein